MAGQYNFTIEQGATFQRSIKWKDGAGNPIDLSGYTARMQIREESYTGKLAIELTSENGGIRLDIVESTITIYISAIQTAKMNPISYVYDLEMVNGDLVIRLLEGSISVKPEVTR